MTQWKQDIKMIAEKKEDEMRKLGERIKIVRGKRAQETFATSLGISRGALSFYERGQNEPSSGTLSKICIKDNISTAWLLFGTGEMSAPPLGGKSSDTSEVLPPDGVCEKDITEFFIVPLVEIHFKSEDNTFETSKLEEWNYAFRRGFLEKKGCPEQMIFMRVTGDSMEPDIKNDDIVLIDQQQTQLKAGKIYAVGIEGLVYLKYVDAEPGHIILSCPNKGYKPIILETGEQRENIVRIIGRVISIGRELN